MASKAASSSGSLAVALLMVAATGCSVDVSKLRPAASRLDAPVEQPPRDDGSLMGDADTAWAEHEGDGLGDAAADADGTTGDDGHADAGRREDVGPTRDGDDGDPVDTIPDELADGVADLGTDESATDAPPDLDRPGDLRFPDGAGNGGDGRDATAPDRVDGRGGDLRDGGANPITQYAIPTADSEPWGIAAGPDGRLWFTERSGNRIGCVSVSGELDEFPLPVAGSQPYGIVTGPDGNLWFTEYAADAIARITPTGAIDEFRIYGRGPAGVGPAGIAASALASYVWFTELTGNQLGRVSTSTATLGAIEEFPIMTLGTGPSQITVAPDSSTGYWFTESSGNRLGKATTAGLITEQTILGLGTAPEGITVGPDSAIWFTLFSANQIGRVPASGPGGVKTFAIPTANSQPASITVGPDGNLWFTEYGAHQIGRITPKGEITEFDLPGSGNAPRGIVAGPDGNIWFVESGTNMVSFIVP